jgi:Uma2 family endonuclease
LDKDKKPSDKIREHQVTYEMYAEMPDDGSRYEIVDGTLEMMSPGTSTTHQAVSGELMYLLMLSCKTDYKIFHPPFDVIFDKVNVLQPDLMMVHRSRLDIVTARGIEGAPDLVVEILSPSSRKRDKIVKRRVYAKHGVPEYWLIDTDSRTLEQNLLVGEAYELINLFQGEDRVTSDKLPCVSYTIGDIFKEII